MSKKPAPPRIPAKLQPWFDARQRFRLSDATIQMARELGLNPRNFGSLDYTRNAPWKASLSEFIADCYYKARKRLEPERVRSLEQLIQDNKATKAQSKQRKALREQTTPDQAPTDDHPLPDPPAPSAAE